MFERSRAAADGELAALWRPPAELEHEVVAGWRADCLTAASIAELDEPSRARLQRLGSAEQATSRITAVPVDDLRNVLPLDTSEVATARALAQIVLRFWRSHQRFTTSP